MGTCCVKVEPPEPQYETMASDDDPMATPREIETSMDINKPPKPKGYTVPKHSVIYECVSAEDRTTTLHDIKSNVLDDSRNEADSMFKQV